MTRNSPYGGQYQRIRQMILGEGVVCAHCRRARATTLDHDPPLAMHVHRPGAQCCRLIPSCVDCNREGGLAVQRGLWRPGMSPASVDFGEPEPEREGLDRLDPRFRVPWLRGLRRVPGDAVWPRLMSVPHRRAVGTLGPTFVRYAERRSGRKLRWWQRLVAYRMLEVDAAGELVWGTVVLSMSRQLGKSWLLRELCLWRIEQGERFGEPQDVLHTGKDLAVCKEVQRPARVWAKARPAYRVREVNGQEEIERLADGSRWMLRAKEAVYGYSVSLAAVDEAWKVRASSVDEGLTPTMIEREQPQLVLMSTAHRLATALMLRRRQTALDELEAGEGDLLVEWSAPAEAELDDERAWRLASPHWTEQRRHLIARRLEAMRAGEVDDPEEPDPEASFRSQWLNQWPRKISQPLGANEPLLPAGLWAELCEPGLQSLGEIFVAVEDDYGLGAAVAVACRREDGRIELDGWLCADVEAALADAEALAAGRRVRELLLGASLAERIPAGRKVTLAGTRETRVGLALLRDVALSRQLVHDRSTADLDEAFEIAHVREGRSGLFLVSRGPTHLLRAAVWATAAAHRPAPVPAIF
jgi:hypothetical protein